eukprot:1156435-Pelagomonas_calceolata.AAC.5
MAMLYALQNVLILEDGQLRLIDKFCQQACCCAPCTGKTHRCVHFKECFSNPDLPVTIFLSSEECMGHHPLSRFLKRGVNSMFIPGTENYNRLHAKHTFEGEKSAVVPFSLDYRTACVHAYVRVLRNKENAAVPFTTGVQVGSCAWVYVISTHVDILREDMEASLSLQQTNLNTYNAMCSQCLSTGYVCTWMSLMLICEKTWRQASHFNIVTIITIIMPEGVQLSMCPIMLLCCILSTPIHNHYI